MRTKLFTLIALVSMAVLGSSFTTATKQGASLMAPVGGKKGTKKNAVKRYPNPSTNGRITVSSNLDQPLHFYVFELDGTLVHQVILKDKEKQTIHNLKKGIYVYDAFLNDEGVEHGSIIVK